MENQIELYHDATVLLLGRDLAELRRFEETLRKRYQEGYQRGWNEAKDRYCVTYHCRVCGGVLEVTSDAEKAVVKRAMREQGWGHSSCVRHHG